MSSPGGDGPGGRWGTAGRGGRPAGIADLPSPTEPGPGGQASTPAPAASAAGASFAISPPTIALPKGGGAIAGIGEKFTANPATGTGSLSVPLAVSPGRSGFGPELTLTYDSGAGNGPFGLGWQLSLPAITRKTDKGLPRYRDAVESDVYVLAGAEDLVPELDPTTGLRSAPTHCRTYGQDYLITRYRPRVEGVFDLIERWTRAGDLTDVFWRTITRDNVTTWYGRTPESRVVDPADPARIFSWSICQRHDDKGNVIEYGYAREDGRGVDRAATSEANRYTAGLAANTYIKHIRYGNSEPFLPTMEGAGTTWATPDQVAGQAWMFEVVFDYGDHTAGTGGPGAVPVPAPDRPWSVRADPFSSHRAGFEVRTLRLCRRVLMFHHFPGVTGIGADCLVRSTDLAYREPTAPDDPTEPGYTVLTEVVHRAYRRRMPPEVGYETRQQPPLTFTYSEPRVDPTVRTLPPAAVENLPVGPHGAGYRWIDLDGEGLSGVLAEQAGTWYYKAGLGDGGFAPVRAVARVPAAAALSGGRQQLLDLAGDGRLDLVDFGGPAPGFHERDLDAIAGWSRFVAFRSLPNLDWSHPDLRFVDLTGDGHGDALITENEVFTWHPSLDEDGFGPAERTPTPVDDEAGPRLVFADRTETVFLADMTGDGLTDLVRVRNHAVCYWPSLGYGRFGPKVTLANSPGFDRSDLYDPARVLLADVDGSGPADVVYVGRDGAQVYLNRSGNSLSDGLTVPLPLATDDPGAVQAADLLGDGTACLVWSSDLSADARCPVRYVALMGVKPHLLVTVDNNLGGRTEIEYTPSTRFYLQDRQAGTPWTTRLPFPVHCVSRTTVRDKWRGTAFSSTYSYHHGHFDGEEREFRGFGRVEQVDVEAYGTFAAGNPDSPFITEDRSLYQPPVKTITWYDTGAARVDDGEGFAARYDVTGFAERPADPPDALPGLTDGEWREAARARRGRVLRQEAYELDVDDLAGSPGSGRRHTPVRIYSAATHTYQVEMLQPRGANRHAVFLVTERESLIYQHDLALPPPGGAVAPDPRVTHTLTLRHDPFGNPQQVVTVGYGRFGTGLPKGLPATVPHQDRIQRVQAEQHVNYSELRHTDALVVAGPAVPGTTSAVRHHRLPLVCQQRTYELTGLAAASGYFDVGHLRRHALCADALYPPVVPGGQTVIAVGQVDYHQQPPPGEPTRRLIEHLVTLYRRDEDGIAQPDSPHPLGRHGPRGLKHEDYKLALTRGLLAAAFREFDPTTGDADDKLAWTLDAGGPPVGDLLDDPTISGYVAGTDLDPSYTDQLWIASGRAGFATDAPSSFYLPDDYTDPFGNQTTLQYDARHLFVEVSTDPGRNTVQLARFDLRTLTPCEMVDANANHTEVALDILGHVVAAATKGKPRPAGQWQGDHLDGLTPALLDPDPTDVQAFCLADMFDEATARAWLGPATTRFVHHFGERRDPVTGVVTWADRMAVACAVSRERHASAAGPLQVGLECSDGTGAVLMTKVRAEPEQPGGPGRWVVGGLTVLNNKGNPVKQYEPAFTADFGAQLPPAEGITPVMYYDAAGRLVRTEHPDGTVSRVELSPWLTRSFDPNDTALTSRWYQDRDQLDPADTLPRDLAGVVTADPEQRAGWLAARHDDTPSISVVDSLGRPVVAIAHNRVEDPAGTLTFDGRKWRDEHYATHTHLDAEGKPLWVRDPRGNLVEQHVVAPKPSADPGDAVPDGSVPGYDLAGNVLFQHSMDGGSRWMLPDANGQPLLTWDANDVQPANGARVQERRLFHVRYDALRRPSEQWLRAGAAPAVLLEAAEHLDTAGLGAPALAAAQDRNLIGRRIRHYDTSGLATLERVDVDGAEEEVTRTLLADGTAQVVDWDVGDRSALLARDGGEIETFRQITEHDALGRPTTIYAWHRDRPAEAGRSDRVAVAVPTYNERSLLVAEALHVRAAMQTAADGRRSFTPDTDTSRNADAVTRITWNARGQKLSLETGNGTVTDYTYDPASFRLVHLETRRDGAGVQDLHYTYDAAGNVTHVHDDAQDTIWFANQQVEPSRDYTYDALDRLTGAEGRENAAGGATPHPPGDWPRGAIPSADATRRYVESYRYDPAGNVEQVSHAATPGGWTRNHAYAADSNRLVRTWYGTAGWDGTAAAQRTEHRHDRHGNLHNLAATTPGLDLVWDWHDMIGAADLLGGGWAYYQYGVDKQRSRKRLERNGTTEERIYLPGYERYRRWVGTTLVEEIESTHLLEGEQRVLLVDDVLTSSSGADHTLFRYQYGDHLGSVGTELDADAQVIAYEELHPYGTTAYRLANSAIEAPPRRYRYTGLERDDETGLDYHHARCYAPRFGRWISCDPAGLAGGPNLYAYAGANPVRSVDPAGRKPKKVDEKPAAKKKTKETKQDDTSKAPSPDAAAFLARSPIPTDKAKAEQEIMDAVAREPDPKREWQRLFPEDPDDPEHNFWVAYAVNYALLMNDLKPGGKYSRKDAQKLEGALWFLTKKLRQKNPKIGTSESLILRDAQRYLYGIQGDAWLKDYATKTYVKKFLPADLHHAVDATKPVLSGKLIDRVYEQGAKRAVMAVNAAGEELTGHNPGFLRSSQDKPHSRTGGEDWYDLGLANYGTRGKGNPFITKTPASVGGTEPNPIRLEDFRTIVFPGGRFDTKTFNFQPTPGTLHW
jgi:RHS repeat-associated protein